MLCDPKLMTKADLDLWSQTANYKMISEYSVAWAASESPVAWEIAQEWIQSPEPMVASAGWQTLSCYVAITSDDQLPMAALKKLIKSIPKAIKGQPVRVAYTMNAFLIACGSYVSDLTELALEIAEKVGKLELDLGDNDCKIPCGQDYINKVVQSRPSWQEEKDGVLLTVARFSEPRERSGSFITTTCDLTCL